jgi:hypothetical protein
MLSQPLISQPVGIAVRMLSAVKLNDQPPFSTHKVDNMASDGLLANELAAFNASRPWAIPQASFRIGGICPKFSRDYRLLEIGATHVDTPPHPARCARRPLPASGER